MCGATLTPTLSRIRREREKKRTPWGRHGRAGIRPRRTRNGVDGTRHATKRICTPSPGGAHGRTLGRARGRHCGVLVSAGPVRLVVLPTGGRAGTGGEVRLVHRADERLLLRLPGAARRRHAARNPG